MVYPINPIMKPMKKLYNAEPTIVIIGRGKETGITTLGSVTYPSARSSITIISNGNENPANSGAITIIPVRRVRINP